MNRLIEQRRAAALILSLFLFSGVYSPRIAEAQPAVTGRWTTVPETMPINPVHAALLRTGTVLILAGSGNKPSQAGGPYQTAVWNPNTGSIATQNIPWDLWCGGTAFLPDGRAFWTGGTLSYNPFSGLRNTTLFDPVTSTFTRVADMAHGRWYPTNIALPDGRIATFSGYDEAGNANKTFEIYPDSWGSGKERPMNWPSTPPNYPRGHLTPQGDIFFSGWQRQSHRFNPQTLQWTYNVAVTRYTGTRRYGSSVLLPLRPDAYPARVLIVGGGVSGSATGTAELIDLSQGSPQWNYTGALHYPRVELNAVLLPNGRVLAVGGSAVNNTADSNGGGRFSEMYDPETGVWTVMDQQDDWRFYHSNALLLPDGRVASVGGNPKQGVYENSIEIYSPPYLYTSTGALASRPAITGAPTQIAYGASFDVSFTTQGSIAEAVLVRPGAATHAFDMEQRLVELEIASVLTGQLSLVGPPNANIAPPGYYMLFLINTAGAPSVARFVRLSASGSPPPPPPPPTGNLLANAGFESDAASWTGASGKIVTGTVHTGAKALQVRASSSSVVLITQVVPVQAGAGYRASAWIKTTDGYTAGASLQLQWLRTDGTAISSVAIGTLAGTQNWTQVAKSVTAPAGAVKVRCKLYGKAETDGVGTAYFDDTSLSRL